MTRVSLTEEYDDRSVISRLDKMEKAVSEGVTAIAKDKTEINDAVTKVDSTVSTVANAVNVANSASATATQAATTVAEYSTRLTALEDDHVTTRGDSTIDGDIHAEGLYAQTLDVTDANLGDQVSAAGVSVEKNGGVECLVSGLPVRFSSMPTLGSETIGDADKPIYIKDGKPTACTEPIDYVTLGTEQSITGAKTFKGFACLRTASTGNYGLQLRSQFLSEEDNKAEYATSRIQTLHRAYDKDGNILWDRQLSKTTTGRRYVIDNLAAPDGSTFWMSINSRLASNGGGYVELKESPPTDASSGCVVTKGYVSATDGTTNNLVHTEGAETIAGNKTFTGRIITDVQPAMNATEAYGFSGSASASNTYVDKWVVLFEDTSRPAWWGTTACIKVMRCNQAGSSGRPGEFFLGYRRNSSTYSQGGLQVGDHVFHWSGYDWSDVFRMVYDKTTGKMLFCTMGTSAQMTYARVTDQMAYRINTMYDPAAMGTTYGFRKVTPYIIDFLSDDVKDNYLVWTATS